MYRPNFGKNGRSGTLGQGASSSRNARHERRRRESRSGLPPFHLIGWFAQTPSRADWDPGGKEPELKLYKNGRIFLAKGGNALCHPGLLSGHGVPAPGPKESQTCSQKEASVFWKLLCWWCILCYWVCYKFPYCNAFLILSFLSNLLIVLCYSYKIIHSWT